MSSSVLMISHDLVGPQMAGSGMRYWELARVLAAHCNVTLAAPEGSAPVTEPLPMAFVTYHRYDIEAMRPLVESCDIVVSVGDTLLEFPFLLDCDKYIVMDGYDPHTLESLAWNQGQTPEQRLHGYRDRLRVVDLQCTLGDFFICASERQRMLWLGWLEARGRINPFTYDEDPTLRSLIGVVPTGVPTEPPRHTRPLVREVVRGISREDFVLVWGGGIWDWLDPLTLIRAVAQVVPTIPQVRLYFPGPRHPDRDRVPDMDMRRRAIELSQALGLWQRHVFVGEWVPYADRQNYLLEANVGCSLHFPSIESTFAFRTRVLDYIWAGLPMIVTRGDVASELVAEHDLGVVVDYADEDGVAEAIARLFSIPRASFQERFARVRQDLRWERNAQPLVRFCRAPRRAPDKDALGGPYREGADLAQVVEQEKEIARLRGIVAGYERGRFMRFMKWVHQTQRRARALLSGHTVLC
jgi:glycosyltransferase involved in cell wall biosynthesis